MKQIKKITEAEFKKELAESKLLIVDFGAD